MLTLPTGHRHSGTNVLEQIASNHPLGIKFVQDGRTLESKASEPEYTGLEEGLVGYIKAFTSGQSYGNVARNEFGDRFISILEYIALIDRKFNTDPRKVKNIRLAVIRAFREKVGTGAFRFIPQIYKGLHKIVERELEAAERIY